MRSRMLESDRAWLWLIIIVGAILRLYRLDFQSLWLDEGLQYYVAHNNSIAGLLGETRSFHPPLSFIVNHLFLQIGESEFFLRLPSALFGIATVPVFYLLVCELTSRRRVALLSTCLLTISPFHIWYSQEGRMYAQVLFFSVLSSVVLLQAMRRGGSRWWIAYIVISVAGMYTQVFMVLALLAQFVWVVFWYRKFLIPHLASGVAIFVVFLPWVLFLPWVRRFFQGVSEQGLGAGAALGSSAAFRAGFSWESIPYTLFAYSSGFSVGPTVAELHENRSLKFILQFAPEISLVTFVFGALFLLGIYAQYKLFSARLASFCLLGLCLPIIGTLLYALAPRATYNVRYSIVGFPYFCIIAGTGLTLVFQKYRSAGAVLLLGIVGISSTALGNYFFNPRYAKEDIRSAVAFWRSDLKAGPLLSYQSHHVLSVYLTKSEKERHSRLSSDVVSDINQFFSKTDDPFVYVLFARDWRNRQQNVVVSAYRIADEKSYPGVTILKLVNPQRSRRPMRATQCDDAPSSVAICSKSTANFE